MCSAAVHLRRSKPDAQITLIDASGRPGTGAAYGTNDPTHLLNVPAPRMSAWPDDPDHFTRWLDQRAVTPAESFAPRLAYGRYLQDQLAAADVRIEAAEVVELIPGCSGSVGAQRWSRIYPPTQSYSRPAGRKTACPTRWNVPSPRCWPTAPTAGSSWTRGRPARWRRWVHGGRTAFWSSVRGSPVSTSRCISPRAAPPSRCCRGMARSRADSARPVRRRSCRISTRSRGDVSLEQIARSARRRPRARPRRGLDWRQVIDAIRPRTARLWQSLGWEDQRRFLREDLRQWEVLRHRMPPTIADAIHAAIDSGQLVIEAGEVADVSLRRKGVELVVTTSDGSVRRRGDAVVVAAGAAWDRRSLHGSPLWANLLAAEVASLHPCGVGVRLTPDGYLIDAAGSTVPNIVCIGPSDRARNGKPPLFPKSVLRQRLSRHCSPTAPPTSRRDARPVSSRPSRN